MCWYMKNMITWYLSLAVKLGPAEEKNPDNETKEKAAEEVVEEVRAAEPAPAEEVAEEVAVADVEA